MSNLNAEEYKSFESIKHVRENGKRILVRAGAC